MKRLLEKFNLKRIVSILLLLSMLSSYFMIDCVDSNYAFDPTLLQSNYINLMKGGKAGVTGNTDAIMTLDDLRNVAMFLSCSYVPFYTSLDGDSKEKWVEKGVSMLTQIGFDKQVATTLVNATYEASLNSASKIYVSTGDLGQVRVSLTGTKSNGFGRNRFDGAYSSGWFMTTEGSGASGVFIPEGSIVVNGLECPYVNVAEIFYKNGKSKVPVITDEKEDKVTKAKDEIITSVKADNVKYLRCGSSSYHFYPYNEAEHSGKPIYQLYCLEHTVIENPGTDKQKEKIKYKMIMAKGGADEGNLNNRFVLLEESQFEVETGIMNNGYRRAVSDGGYAGYTPLTLEMFWVLIDNFYNDFQSLDVEKKTGHVKRDNKINNVNLYASVTNTTVIDANGGGESGESSTEESTEASTDEDAGIATVDVNTTDSPIVNTDTGSLSVVGVIDANFISYLGYMASFSDDANIGGLLNAFVNGDIGGMFDGNTVTVSNGEFESLIALFQCMYVDWVGNILVDVGTERVIVVPACANKYAFTDIENHDIKLNMLSPMYMQLLNSGGKAMHDISANGIVHGDSVIQVPEILSKGSAAKATWDNDPSIFKWSAGSAGGLKNYLLQNYGVSSPGDLANEWTEDSVFNLIRSIDMGREGIFSDMLLYESIKQSGKGQVTDFSSSLISTSLLDSWGSYSNYFSAERSNKFKGGGNYDKFFSFTNNDTNMLQNLFLTYTFAFTNHVYHEPFDSSKHYIDMRFNYDVFPLVTGTLQWEAVDSTESEIASFIYYFLHPTKGIKYVATWFKNKVSGIFVNWHEDVVGSSDSNSVTGMTQYLGFSGYVTTPNLEDISWISSLVRGYNSIVIYLILIMMVILICYVLVGTITLQRGVVGIAIFASLAFLPPIGINAVVNIINKTCESMYSTKFDYWAAVQTEEYLSLLNNVENAVTVTDYVTALMQTNAEASASTSIGGASATGYSGVKVKWLSPKKFNELAAFSEEVTEKITNSKSGVSGWTINALMSTQEFSTGMEFYLNSDSATYLYRDLLDIYRYGSCSYYLYEDWGSTQKEFMLGSDLLSKYTGSCMGSKVCVANPNLRFNTYVMANIESPVEGYTTEVHDDIRGTSSVNAIRKGFLYPTVNTNSGSVNYFDKGTNTLAANLLLTNSKCIDIITEKLDDLKSYTSSGQLKLSVNDIVNGNHNVIFGLDQWIFKNGVNEFISGNLKPYENGDGGLDGYYYSLYSESPYYFFSFNIRDQVHSSLNYYYDYQSLKNSNGTDKFYKMLIKNNQDYFYNLSDNAGDGYGELRDFMNMHDFFYYIMPALRPGNELVNLFADVFGMEVSDHSTLHLGADGKIQYSDMNPVDSLKDLEDVLNKMTKEELYDFWHDYNVRTVYNAYTPWLNLMEACDYAKPEKIRIAGESFTVTNPLDPTSYFTTDTEGKMLEGRYMIFSRSEQKEAGVLWNDLTTVERKIITLQDNVYEQAIRIMNYYDLSNETLISYLAMLELFEFNKEFSQTSFFGSSYTLYPQSYELKAFTYDAYLRLILNGSTEGSNYQDELQVAGSQSIYERVLEKTSIFFGIVLLANDFVAVYLIPMLKLFFLVTIFLVSILIIIAATTKLDTPGGGILQVIWKSIVSPLLSYALISICMAAAVVLFMSSGGGNVTRRTLYISLGDPTMTCIMMLIINIVALVLYFKVCRKVFKDFKTYVTSVFDNIGSNVVGAFGAVSGAIAAGGLARRLKHIDKGLRSGGGSARQRGMANTPESSGSGATSGGSSSGGSSGGLSSPSKYDTKASNLSAKANAKDVKYQQKENRANDRLEKSKEKAEKMQNKYGVDSKQADKALLKMNKREAQVQSIQNKRDGAISNYVKKMDNIQKDSANVSRYGKAYGSMKNIGERVNGVVGRAAQAGGNALQIGGQSIKGAGNVAGGAMRVSGEAIKKGGYIAGKGVEAGGAVADAGLKAAGSGITAVGSIIPGVNVVTTAVGTGMSGLGTGVRGVSKSGGRAVVASSRVGGNTMKSGGKAVQKTSKSIGGVVNHAGKRVSNVGNNLVKKGR